LLRVGIIYGVAKILAAEDKHEPMFAHRLDEYLHIRDANALELVTHRHAALGRGSPCAPVCDEALGIHGTKVATNSDVEVADFEINTQGLEDASADAVFQGIVAEEAEMTRSASGGNALEHRDGEPRNPFAGKGIEIGSACGLELGFARGLQGQATESIGHQQYDFTVRGLSEFADKVV
jgi:hypothetical protein